MFQNNIIGHQLRHHMNNVYFTSCHVMAYDDLAILKTSLVQTRSTGTAPEFRRRRGGGGGGRGLSLAGQGRRARMKGRVGDIVLVLAGFPVEQVPERFDRRALGCSWFWHEDQLLRMK